MQLSHAPAAAVWLFVFVSSSLPAQKVVEVPERQGQRGTASLLALREVQAALHAAENAQLELLSARRRDRQTLASVDAAIRNLTQARRTLRDRIRGREPGRVPGRVPVRTPVGRNPRSGDPRRGGGVVRKPLRVQGGAVAAQKAESIALASHPALDASKINVGVERGLKWLLTHQDQDGRWDSDGFSKHDPKGAKTDGKGSAVHDVGLTGLAILAFLADGNTTKKGPYKEAVQKAVQWLRKQQGKNGLFGTPASHDFIYDHAIAAYAMCEAFGASKERMLRTTAQAGINYLESHRNPYACWRYQPRDNDNDISVTSWCLKADRSARAHGLQVNEQALKIGENFMDELTDPVTGRHGYTKRGELSSRHPGDHSQRFPIEKAEALTAVGLSTRLALGQTPVRSRVMTLAADTLLSKPPTHKDKGAIDHYYWFHGTQGMQGMTEHHWDQWSRAAGHAVLTTQRGDGSFAGSWDGTGVWGEDGGRLYATALMTMTLSTIAKRQKR